MESLHHRLEALSPQHILQKGFSVVLNDGTVVTSEAQVKPGQQLVIQLAEGSIAVQVISPLGTVKNKPQVSEKDIGSQTQLSLFD